MPSFPHVKSLKLRNFKGVAELDLEFDESLTLLAGVNGVGKTSVLQALLAAVTTAWSVGTDLSYPLFRFPGSVRRAGASEAHVVLELTLPDGSPIEARYTADGQGRSLNLVDSFMFFRSCPGRWCRSLASYAVSGG